MKYSDRRKVITLVYLSFLVTFSAKAQQENVWIFGTHAGVEFNTAPPASLTSSIMSTEACASVCNDSGELLFYTDGNKVWDKDDHVMPDGPALITDMLYIDSTWLTPTMSTSQGALITPVPEHPDQYYIFSMTSVEYGANYGRLYYSVVDMTLNDGLGDIVPGSKGILLDTLLTEHLAGVTGDHCNIWIVALKITGGATEQFRCFEVTGTGINTTPVVSDFTTPFAISFCGGQINVSPDRQKLAIGRATFFSTTGVQELYDFDPGTGLLSNQIILDSVNTCGVCFSPDNSKLYFSHNSAISQYDISLGSTSAVIGSRTYIGAARTSILKGGPDGKIYAVGTDGNELNSIDFPNLPGSACSYTPGAIGLAAGTSTYFGLPNGVPVMYHDSFYTTQVQHTPCFAGSLSLTALNDSTGWDYVWSTETPGASKTVSAPGTYWVSYHTPPCNYNVDTFHVAFDSRLPLLSAMAGCYGRDNGKIKVTPVTGDTITYVYTWMDTDSTVLRGPTGSSIGDSLVTAVNGNSYYLYIGAPNGCDTILEIVVPLPDYTVSFSLSDTIVCINEEVSFYNTSTEDISGFTWSFGDGAGSVDNNPLHTYANAGIYTIRLTGHTGYPCYDTAYYHITVDSMAAGRFVADKDSICTGETVLFTSSHDDSTVVNMDWHFGDDFYMLHSEPGTIQHAYDRDGIFPVTLTTYSRACPEATFMDTLYVFPMPVVNLGDDAGICLNGSPVFLQNLYVDTTIHIRSHTWSTGDTTAVIKVVHPGTYNLTVRAEPAGCSATDVIEVKKDCYIDVPNAFTPDGDGINDYFFPRQLLSKKLTEFHMQVFNRWGQIIFETASTDGRGWDGKYNSEDQPGGVYIYLIDVTINGITREYYKGNVTLLR